MIKKIHSKTLHDINKGFTIVELLIYLALMAMFLLVLLDIFTTTINSKLESESVSALNQDSRYILAKLSYDVNNADSVPTPLVGITGTSLQLVTSGITATFASTSGNLVKTVGGVSQSLNGLDTSLTNLSFKNIGNTNGRPTIQVAYTLTSKVVVNGGNKTQSVNTTVGTR